MARKRAQLQVNNFAGGLVTEINPLEYPPNVSFSEDNMVINRDNSRQRRKGYDLEGSFVLIDTGLAFAGQPSLQGSSQFEWTNAGGDPNKSLMVVQVGNHLAVYDLDTTPLSSAQLYSTTFDSSLYSNSFSYAVVDGLLVFVTGAKDVQTLEYSSAGSTISASTSNLRVRDLFGVEATVSSVVITSAQETATRPATTVDGHTYNLRNQTFAIPRYNGATETRTDPITAFTGSAKNSAGLFPSNSDNVLLAYFADANDSDDRLTERYFPDTALANPPGSARAPTGYFIIDALERGVSRKSEMDALHVRETALGNTITSLPVDTTPNGAACIVEYAGRVWYGGFSGEVSGSDSRSPFLSSYVMFSQLITDRTGLTECYQQADPTSPVDSELVDTDGGFIRIDGAYGIKAMRNLGESLIVYASNGIWAVEGGDAGGFTATNYRVTKINDKGCEGANSVIVTGSTSVYWGKEDIHAISRNEVGEWGTDNTSFDRIKTLYDAIPPLSKQMVSGHFDETNGTAHWVYPDDTVDGVASRELTLTLKQLAFAPNSIPTVGLTHPRILTLAGSPDLGITTTSLVVTVGGVTVTDNAVTVTVATDEITPRVKEIYYVVEPADTDTIQYTFALRGAAGFYDWSTDGAGGPVDSPAHLLTGSLTGGQARENKNANYLTLFFNKTELVDLSGVDLFESSCILNSQWNWTVGSQSGVWSSPRQAYRSAIPRLGSTIDPVDNGESMVITRNKIRGSGHSVAFRMESEPGKGMHIFGWAFDLQAEDQD